MALLNACRTSSLTKPPILPSPTTSTTTRIALPIERRRKPLSVSCAVAAPPPPPLQVKTDVPSVSIAAPPSEVKTDVPSVSTSFPIPVRELSMVGARVRVKQPVKVFSAPRVGAIELRGMEGVIKQYVGFWKGMPLTASLPFRVEFVKNVEGRGPVKFLAHLQEEEFELI